MRIVNVLAYGAVGVVIGWLAGMVLRNLPAPINIAVMLIVAGSVCIWAFRSLRQLKKEKRALDEMISRLEEMRRS